MALVKYILRGLSLAIILVCAIWGFYLVTSFEGSNEAVGIAMLRMLYEYGEIQDVYDREKQIQSQCSESVWDWISFWNDEHWSGTWSRTRNLPSKVRVVFTRPGLIIYALENDFVYPTYLWCFEYKLERGVFTEIREYQLVGNRRSEDGGLL